MAFKRYIHKHGKKLGPYYYENIRSPDGKVKTIYIGTNPRHHPKHRIRKPLFFLILALILILILGGSLFFLQNKSYLIKKVSLKEPDFDVDQILLKVLVRSGEYIEKQIRVMNTGSGQIGVNAEALGLSDIVRIDSPFFTLKPGQTKIVGLNFSSFMKEQNIEQQPGVYVGKLIVKSEKAVKEVPMVAEIETKNVLFDMNLNPVAIERRIKQGSDATIEVRLFNLESIESANVDVEYFVKDINGNTIITESETVVVETQASFFKTISIPKNLEPGPYVFAAQTRLGSSIGTASYLFEVIGPEEQAFLQFCKNNILCMGLSLTAMLLLFALTAYFYFFIGAYIYERVTGSIVIPKKKKEEPEEEIAAEAAKPPKKQNILLAALISIRKIIKGKQKERGELRNHKELDRIKLKREKLKLKKEFERKQLEQQRLLEEAKAKLEFQRKQIEQKTSQEKEKLRKERRKKIREFLHKIGLYKTPEEKKKIALQKETEKQERLRKDEELKKQKELEGKKQEELRKQKESGEQRAEEEKRKKEEELRKQKDIGKAEPEGIGGSWIQDFFNNGKKKAKELKEFGAEPKEEGHREKIAEPIKKLGKIKLQKEKLRKERRKKIREFLHKIGLYKTPEEKKKIALQKETEKQERLRRLEELKKQKELEGKKQEELRKQKESWEQRAEEEKRKKEEEEKARQLEKQKAEEEKRRRQIEEERKREELEAKRKQEGERKKQEELRKKEELERKKQEQIRARKSERIKRIEELSQKNKVLSRSISEAENRLKHIGHEVLSKSRDADDLDKQKNSLHEAHKKQIDELSKNFKDANAKLADKENHLMKELYMELGKLPLQKRKKVEKWRKLEIKAKLKVEEQRLQEELENRGSRDIDKKRAIESDYKKSLEEINKKQIGISQAIADLKSQKKQLLIKLKNLRIGLEAAAKEHETLSAELSQLKSALPMPSWDFFKRLITPKEGAQRVKTEEQKPKAEPKMAGDLDKCRMLLQDGKEAFDKNEINKSGELYAEARKLYVNLANNEKKEVYDELMDMYNMLKK